MRILKYLFLLLLLSLVSLSIFTATQKGDFIVERSKIINSSKSAVFNYVNDYRNWDDFSSWSIQDPKIKSTYSQNTIGVNASYTWEGNNDEGSMQTFFVKENDSISQKMDYNGTSSTVFWSFKDTIGGTKVTWKSIGKMSYFFKIYTALNGGVDKVLGRVYEKSLVNLDKVLDFEINTYSAKVNGITKKSENFYLAQTFTSEISKVHKNMKIVIPKIIDFCKKNSILINGKPFIIYHTYNLTNKLAKISICVPIKKEIFISAGSDILSGKLESFEGIKTTYTGDYSHINVAFDKTIAYLNKNQLVSDPLISHIEIYEVSKDEIKSPSKWVTEIYIPLKQKIEPVNNAPQKTTNNTINYKAPTQNTEPVIQVRKPAIINKIETVKIAPSETTPITAPKITPVTKDKIEE